MRRQILRCAIGLSLALGPANAYAAEVAPGAGVRTISDHNSGPAILDLGSAARSAGSQDLAPMPPSDSAMGSAAATAVPELPTWVMMFLCFLGLAVAVFKRGRKDRLSPGID